MVFALAGDSTITRFFILFLELDIPAWQAENDNRNKRRKILGRKINIFFFQHIIKSGSFMRF